MLECTFSLMINNSNPQFYNCTLLLYLMWYCSIVEIPLRFIWHKMTACAPRGVVPGGVRGTMAPPDFGRSVNPISTRGDRLCPPNCFCHPQIFRPSDSLCTKQLASAHPKFLKGKAFWLFFCPPPYTVAVYVWFCPQNSSHEKFHLICNIKRFMKF